MKSLFEYLDYRLYLADYIADQKKTTRLFSFKTLADKAGFGARDFLYRVIKGQRNLTDKSARQVSTALCHTSAEAEYFKTLVFYNQEDNPGHKERLYHTLISLNTRKHGTAHLRHVREEQYEYYSTWYHSVVRSLIDLHRFSGDFARLAGKVRPQITTRQAKSSVQLLESLGLIIKESDGTYRVTDKTITTGPDLSSPVIRNYHRATIDMASRAMDIWPGEERDTSSLTLGISKQTFEKMRKKLREFRHELLQLARDDKEADRAYHLNLHFFPVSSGIEEKPTRHL